MAQKLKDEIKDEILKNALHSFVANGYQNTSMKSIAKASGISVGNIYNYFKDKEALYDALVMPVFERIDGMFRTAPKAFPEGVDEKAREFVEIYKSNKSVFVMLLENSGNTKFENSKAIIIDSFAAAIMRFITVIAKKETNQQNTVFVNAYACSIINGAITILKQETDENIKLNVLLKFISSMKTALINTIEFSEG